MGTASASVSAATAPGVIGIPNRVYVQAEDIQVLIGCHRTKAYECIREVNDLAKRKGCAAFPVGRANKYLFAERYGIPIEAVNQVISQKGGG